MNATDALMVFTANAGGEFGAQDLVFGDEVAADEEGFGFDKVSDFIGDRMRGIGGHECALSENGQQGCIRTIAGKGFGAGYSD